jgi:hypothetical protein
MVFHWGSMEGRTFVTPSPWGPLFLLTREAPEHMLYYSYRQWLCEFFLSVEML